MLLRLRERIAVARAGDGVELEQALIRIVNQVVVCLLIAPAILAGKVARHGELLLLVVAPASLLAGSALIGWILARPGTNHARRRAGTILDMTTTPVIMGLTDEIRTILYPF